MAFVGIAKAPIRVLGNCQPPHPAHNEPPEAGFVILVGKAAVGRDLSMALDQCQGTDGGCRREGRAGQFTDPMSARRALGQQFAASSFVSR
jgi:hypothetical protein